MENNNVDNGNNQPRLFTQEEVDEIIKRRLERYKEKHAATADEEAEQRSAALDQRAKDLDQREMMLNCKGYLSEQGYDPELLEIITANSFDDFKQKADKLDQLAGSRSFKAPAYNMEQPIEDPDQGLKAAFSPGYRRKPKDY